MKLILIGGGYLLLQIAKEFGNNNNFKSINIYTSKRQNEKRLNGSNTFKDLSLSICRDELSNKITSTVIENIDNHKFQQDLKISDLCISFGSAWIFKKRHLKLSKNIINVHCTPLPQWRGGGGSSWMILAGINYSNITFHKIDEGLDTGEILYSKKFFFPKKCKTPQDRKEYLDKITFENLKVFINNFIKEGIFQTKLTQQEDFSSYFPRLNSAIHGCIDWSWDSEHLIKFIDAFDDPYEGAFTRVTGREKKVFLKKVQIIEGECKYHPFQSGIIYRKDEIGIYICTNGGAIFCESILDNLGKSIIKEINIGDRLYSTSKDLELAKSTKTTYTGDSIINN